MFPGRTPDVGDGEEYTLNGYAARLYDVVLDNKIVGWRAECFEKIGFTQLQAQAIAIRRDVDREEVERMVKAGATPRQILEIFAHD